jgi:hypothetical protein
MQSDYPLLITLGALLILSPFVKSLMERIGVPALVGYILLGFLVSVMNQQWSFVTTVFNNTYAVLAQLGVVALLFRVGLQGKSPPLFVGQPKPPCFKLILKNTVLFDEIAADRLLMAIKPAGQGNYEEMKGLVNTGHCTN